MEINPRELKDITKAALHVDEDVLKTAPDNTGKLEFFSDLGTIESFHFEPLSLEERVETIEKALKFHKLI